MEHTIQPDIDEMILRVVEAEQLTTILKRMAYHYDFFAAASLDVIHSKRYHLIASLLKEVSLKIEGTEQ